MRAGIEQQERALKMKIDLSQFRQVFLEESAEHITTMESILLGLRSAADDVESLNAIFRCAHSIKGGAGSFGLTNLVRFTHALENLLEQLRSSKLVATGDVIEILLQSIDVLQELLHAEEGAAPPAVAAVLIERMQAFTGAAVSAAPAPESSPAPVALEHSYTINFEPFAGIFESGSEPLLLLRELSELGTVSSCKLLLDKMPAFDALNPERCYLSWTISLSSASSKEEILEVFEFVDHLAKISVESAQNADVPSQPALLSNTEDDTRSLTISNAPRAVSTEVASAPTKLPAAGGESNSIRVPTDKIDRLIDLVGELVIAHVMTEQMVEKFTPECLPQLKEAVSAMQRNMRELHERVMSVRMMPVGTLFQRYTRTVYDIARATGKNIDLEIQGGETEIDKSLLELLGDPLTHLIRNSADHGIETPERRLALGKPEQGHIRLSAQHRAGRIAIEITDDGAGIDPVRVRAKAVERGLIGVNAKLNDQQLKMLIFEPGFSTRDKVSDLSGRGVGMDVVKRNIQQLNGTVTLQSVPGEGSTVTIELPLTLAILEGLIVRVQDRKVVFPLLSVVEMVSPSAGQISRVAEQGEAMTLRGEAIPLLRLYRYFGLPERASDEEWAESVSGPHQDPPRLVVIVESGGKKVGMEVDELMGQQQVVLKSLERHLHRVEGLMGATILGDGHVAPIIDIAGIIELDLFSIAGSQRSVASAIQFQ
jgi:two-component system chemotaxis sensor kinase CheA